MPFDPHRLSRRDFLRNGAAGAALLGTGGLLAACSSNGSAATTTTTTSTTTTTAPKPKRGGSLQVGLTGGTSADTLDPLFVLSNLDFARSNALYDSLVALNRQGVPELSLARELTPNPDGSEWTVRLRPGVTFHNGKDLTADDVIYTFQQMLNPKALGYGSAALTTLDVKGMTKVDALTVRLPFLKPFSSLPAVLASYYYYMIPVGFDPHHPVGTGPYTYKSFTAGEQSTFGRNNNYWMDGLPYTDELVLTDIADETTAVNALMGHNLDCADISSSTLIPALNGAGVQVVISHGGSYIPFVMNTAAPPFTDARVRQAFRLVVDRPQMIESVYDGHGIVGNDVFGIWDPLYDHALPQRKQDIAEAKSLLKSAGKENLSIELVTAPILAGATEQATVFAQQASEAGIKVSLRQVTSTELYGPNYLKWTFSQDYLYYAPYFSNVLLCTLPDSALPETHFDDPEYISLYSEAEATTNHATQETIAHKMQQIDYDLGGYIIACFPPTLDAHSSQVGGVLPSLIGVPFNNYDFKSLWLK
jgi:peptide/nickel transport system substrate-binding protein